MRAKSVGLVGLVVALASGASGSWADDKPLTKRNETVESAVATPVEDLNIKKTKIPEVLLRAQSNPYDLPSAATCGAISTELAAIDAELGDDYDELAVAQNAAGSKGPSAGALLKAGVATAIPFRGLVRQISGAAQHEKEVEQAIDAGFARRGFLKGRAVEMNCAPPASPAWFTPRPEAAAAPAVAQTQPVAPGPVALAAPAAEAATVASEPPAVSAAPEAATTAPAEGSPAGRSRVESAPLPLIPGSIEGVLSVPDTATAETPATAEPAPRL